MKFATSRVELSDRLQIILSVISSKTTLPILANVLIKADGETISLSATDLDLSITTSLSGKIAKPGQTTVHARTFAEIIRELPGDEIMCTEQNNRLEIRTERGVYKISGMAADEFPRLPDIKTASQTRIPTEQLAEMVKKTAYAVSQDETRPALNGILWQPVKDGMRMVATDGHRLARFVVADNRLAGVEEDIILPAKALQLVTKMAADTENEIGVTFGEKNTVFNLGHTTITSRLIEGPYPNYEQVIPADNDKIFTVDVGELTGGVRRVSILSNSLTRQVKFSLSKDTLELSATNQDVGGEAREKIPCNYSGEDIEIGYNAGYVLDILKNLQSEKAEFSLSTSISAGVIKACDGPIKDNYLCLIMPLRLAE
jgi:DNA polymerase-3 subunit beta